MRGALDRLATRLTREPTWYDASSHDCTTKIRQHAKTAGNDPGCSRRIREGLPGARLRAKPTPHERKDTT